MTKVLERSRYNFQYHPGKENVGANALSRRPYPTLNYLIELLVNLCFQNIGTQYEHPQAKSILYAVEAQLTLIKEIGVTQAADPQLQLIKEEVLIGKSLRHVIHEDNTIRFHNRLCVSVVKELKKRYWMRVTTCHIQYTQEEISCTRT